MSRISITYHLMTIALVLWLLCPIQLWAQTPDVAPPKRNAMEDLFVNPEPWSGSRYSSPQSLFERLYINIGIGGGTQWDYNDLMSSERYDLGTKIDLGYHISPVHAIELGIGFNDSDFVGSYNAMSLSYLFDATAYASRLEQPGKWQLLLKSGVDVDLCKSSPVAWSNAMRVQHNFTPWLGLYVEPKASVYVAPNYSSTSYSRGHSVTSVSVGISLDMSEMRDAYIARRNRILNSDYSIEALMAIKTNLLFDCATAINAEVEVPIGDRWSVAGEFDFPWWTWDDGTVTSPRNRLQLLYGDLSGKYWFGERSGRHVMTGWYAGIYAGGGLYDIERDANGYQGEFFIAAGLCGGYAHTINRRGNLRMEYTLGFGYLETDYIHYESEYYQADDWRAILLEKGVYHWFGPTKAKVSLVWLINYKKEGALR